MDFQCWCGEDAGEEFSNPNRTEPIHKVTQYKFWWFSNGVVSLGLLLIFFKKMSSFHLLLKEEEEEKNDVVLG